MANQGPIVIWGAGAIGGTIGAYLARAGHDVLFVDIVEEHLARIRAGQLHIEGPVDQFTTGGSAVRPDQVVGQFGRILLAVKSQHTREAVRALQPHLASDGYVVSCQNGLNAPVIAELIGRERTIAAAVAFAPDWIEPGRIMFGNRGPLTVGELDGAMTPRLLALRDLLADFEPEVTASPDIYGMLWSKASLAVLLKASALTNDTIADFITRADLFPALVALVREVVHVAHDEGLSLHSFQDFDPTAFAGNDETRLRAILADHAVLRRQSAKQHSGVWRDLVVRKRRTEVVEQLEPIRALAKKHGRAVPMIDTLQRLITTIEDGQAAPGDGIETELIKAVENRTH